MDFNLLFVNLIAGSLVGYVTKSLAINMLFKRYPLIGGAEIIKDRENLEKAMSQLVEERLIRPSTLLGEFQKPAFKRSFEDLIHHLMRDSLAQHLHTLGQVGEFQGFEQTTANLRAFLLRQRDTLLPLGLDLLLEHLTLEDLLSPDQGVHLLNQLIATHQLLEGPAAEASWQQLRAACEGITLGELIPEPLFQALLQAGLPVLQQALQDRAVATQLEQLYQTLIADADWQPLEEAFQALSAAQLLGGSDLSAGLEHLIGTTLTFLDSVKGQYLLLKIMQQLIGLLKQVELPLAELLTPRLEQQLVALIERYLPELVEVLAHWLSTHKPEIEALVQEAINTHLQSEHLVKQMIGNIFGQQLTARYQVVENTLAEVQTLLQGPDAAADLSALVSRLLNHTRVDQLARVLEQYILNEKALVRLGLELLHKYLPRLLQFPGLQELLQQPLSALPLLNQLKLSELVSALVQGLLHFTNRRLLSSPKGAGLLFESLKVCWPLLQTLPLSVFLPEDARWSLQLVREALGSSAGQQALRELLALEPALRARPLAQLVPAALRTALCQTLAPVYTHAVDQLLAALQRENVRNLYAATVQLYAEFSDKPEFMQNLAHNLVELMVQLIGEHQLLEGKIYVAIKESFGRFSDDELKDEMDSFMGQELQPIKLLGAILGAGVGAGMWYLSMLPGYSTFVKGNWALLSYSLSYALTEVGTNWMAIKMLFRPYRALKIPGTGWNLPFTPGIFPKNKQALADSMVNFIDKKLLSKDNMVKILEKYHPAWKQAIRRVIGLNDYEALNQTLQRYLRSQYPHLTPVLLDNGFAELYATRTRLAEALSEGLAHSRQLALDLGPVRAALADLLQTAEPDWLPALTAQLQAQITRWELPPELPAAYVARVLPGILTALGAPAQATCRRETLLRALSTPALGKQSLIRFLAPEALGSGIEQLGAQLGAQLARPEVQAQLVQFVRARFLHFSVPAGQTLGDWFDGRLLGVLLNESDFLLDSFAGYFLELARSKQSDLSALILADLETRGVMEFMLLTFGGVRGDIRRVVSVLLDQQLPAYFEQKRPELRQLLEHVIVERIAPIPVSELGLSEEMLNLERILTLMRHYFLAHPVLVPLLHELAEAVAHNLLSFVSVRDLGWLLGLDSGAAVYHRLEPQAHQLQALLSTQWQRHSPLLRPRLEALLSDSGRALGQQSQRWLASVPLPLWQAAASSSFQVLRAHPPLQALSQAFSVRFEAHDLIAALEPLLLRRDLITVIARLSGPDADPERQHQLKLLIGQRFEPVIHDFAAVLHQTLAGETKTALEEIMVNSLIDSLRVNNRELLEPIDFESIVRHAVEEMEPERIESLFDFAQPIFRLLIWYGAWGGVIGLVVGIFEWLR